MKLSADIFLSRISSYDRMCSLKFSIKKLDHFEKYVTAAYNNAERRFAYQNLPLFIWTNG